MIYFFVGSPLGGKTTLTTKLSEKCGFGRFSTGEYARTHGLRDEKSIGELDLSLDLNGDIRSEVLHIMGMHEDTFIIDGFPRSAEQIVDVLNSGVKFKIVFVYINPLIMHERASTRNRDNYDDMETVVGRAKASQELYKMIRSMVDAHDVFFYEDQVDDYKNLEDFVCGE